MLRPSMPDTPDATANPGETIRSDARVKSNPLPTLSVDLRTPPAAAGASGSDLEVRGVIGEGGMGRVLLARQHSLARDVAVKTVKHDATDTARMALVAEGAITGQLEHPSIVPVHALGVDAHGSPALVMKRVEGVTWEALITDAAHPGWEGWEGDSNNRLPGHLQILISVANALHFAHSRGVVHRDVKPQNVLIGRFNDVYLADWGVAGELGAKTTGICGTPAYLAPEMVEADAVVDARTDVYLLGSTLHQLLTGGPRHAGATVTESLQAAQLSSAHRYGPAVPAELGALANRACHKDPAQRPPNARAFRDELTDFSRHRDAVALGEKARGRLQELEPLLDRELDADGREKLERLLAEARFGLEQSLERYAENPPAQAALRRVEDILAQRRREAQRLEAEDRERDPRRGAAWRTGGLFGLTLATGAMTAIAVTLPTDPTPSQLLFFPLLIIGGVSGLSLWFRKDALATRFSRQAVASVLAGLAIITCARLIGLWVPMTPAAQFTRDSFILASSVLVVAIAFFWWAWFPTAFFLLSGLLCSLFPQHAITFFSASTLLAMAVGTAASWRDGRRAEAQRPRVGVGR
jgi:Protein kinase domain